MPELSAHEMMCIAPIACHNKSILAPYICYASVKKDPLSEVITVTLFFPVTEYLVS